MRKRALAAALALAGYDTFVRPWMLDWGATGEERRAPLPGDDYVVGEPLHFAMERKMMLGLEQRAERGGVRR